ncbi:MAG: cupin domain-containing protein [Chitinophagales bacterium]
MSKKITETTKKLVIKKWESSKKFWMTENEFTGIVVGKEATNSEYVITDGVIEPNGFIPNHYHKWEDQTFHIIKGELEIIIGNEKMTVSSGDTIHCPRGIAHYMKNVGNENAKLISYIFPGDWAEDFFAETSRQVKEGKPNLKLIEEKFGVIYLNE